MSVRIGGYCKARQRLPLEMVSGLAQATGRRLHALADPSWRWRERPVKLVDGTGNSELGLLRKLDAAFNAGDVMLGDALYYSYFVIAAMIAAGVDVLFEQNGARNTDFRHQHHYAQIRDVPRILGDLHRLIDAHVEMARQVGATGVKGAQRQARLMDGMAQIILSERDRHGWRLTDAETLDVFIIDHELNAQGPGIWLDSLQGSPRSHAARITLARSARVALNAYSGTNSCWHGGGSWFRCCKPLGHLAKMMRLPCCASWTMERTCALV